VANWFGKPSYLCQQCASLSVWDGRRKGSISELAAAEAECRIMLAQWHTFANAAAGHEADNTSPTLARRVSWRCGGCDFTWRVSPKNRWASVRQKLQRIETNKGILEPDEAFACPRCCAMPSASSAELALALELQVFFPDAYSGFLSDRPPVDLGINSAFRPDIVLPQHKVYVEYDGFRYHAKHVKRDSRRTRQVKKTTGFRILRVRERDSKAGPE